MHNPVSVYKLSIQGQEMYHPHQLIVVEWCHMSLEIIVIIG